MKRLLYIAVVFCLLQHAAGQQPDWASSCVSSVGNNNCVNLDITESYDFQGKEFVFTWDMGDGTRLDGLAVNHCYAESGQYIASLSLYDPITQTVIDNEMEVQVEIRNAFNLTMTLPESIGIGQSGDFSFEIDYPQNYQISEVVWEFGSEGTSTERASSFSFQNDGEQEVQVYVRLVSADDELALCASDMIFVQSPDAKAQDGSPFVNIPIDSRFLRDDVSHRVLKQEGSQFSEANGLEDGKYLQLLYRGNLIFDDQPKFLSGEIQASLNAELEKMAGNDPLKLEPIFFDLDSEKLSGKNKKTLKQNVEILKNFPMLRVGIGVYTNSRGSLDKTVQLSLVRGKLIKDFLVGNGIEEGRLEVVNPLEYRTLINNCLAGDCDSALDRRADFKILKDLKL